MIEKIIVEKSTIKHYSKLLDLAATKNKLTAANIANVETPGYGRKTMDFDKELQKSMNKPRTHSTTTHPRHIPLGDEDNRGPKIKTIKSTTNPYKSFALQSFLPEPSPVPAKPFTRRTIRFWKSIYFPFFQMQIVS